MWLRDALPYDLTKEDTDRPMVQVMIYGYELTIVQSRSIQNLEDLATSFHSSLLPLANTPTLKPIILIAYSLGSLVVKQTIIALSRSENEDDLRLVQAAWSESPLVDSISRINAQILSIQQREFYTALGSEDDSEVVCFYETVESPTAQITESQ
ncbi:hypothetical protein MFIFM68171_00129 [Madurella fahalii]|uniref:Uncharacterized protein n=1 Tax=Madurella fahalii TaxID=1157608 RepID=A0ABQ0FWN8_9PEZI